MSHATETERSPATKPPKGRLVLVIVLVNAVMCLGFSLWNHRTIEQEIVTAVCVAFGTLAGFEIFLLTSRDYDAFNPGLAFSAIAPVAAQLDGRLRPALAYCVASGALLGAIAALIHRVGTAPQSVTSG